MNFKNVLISLVTLGIVSAVPSVVFADTSNQVVETTHGWVSYHSEASLSSQVLGRLTLGESAPLITQANKWWYEVEVNGQDVYITTNSSYTKVVDKTPSATTTSTTPSTSSNTSTSTSLSVSSDNNSSTTSVSSSTSTQATQPQANNSSSTLIVVNNCYLKSSPDLNPATRLGLITKGTKMQLLNRYNYYWYQVKVNGMIGYITTSTEWVQLISAQPSTTTTTTAPVPTPTTTSIPTSTTPSQTTEPSWQVQADKVIATAKTQLNAPYWWGHQVPNYAPINGQYGFDCSNFAAWSYNTALGIKFSGSSVWQRYNEGTPVALSDIREGDLLFFATSNNNTGSGHVGIYMGNGYVIQEGGGYGKVTIENMNTTWFGRNLVYARRVIQ